MTRTMNDGELEKLNGGMTDEEAANFGVDQNRIVGDLDSLISVGHNQQIKRFGRRLKTS